MPTPHTSKHGHASTTKKDATSPQPRYPAIDTPPLPGALRIYEPRTRLASDVGTGKRDFTGLWDCLSKTAKGPKGFMGLYNGFGVSVMGIIP